MMSGWNRVRFRERQVLGEALLVGEQDYQRGRQHEHQARQHIPGIVSGLAVTVDATNTVFLSPGFAIDDAGRQLVLEAAAQVKLPAEDAKTQDGFDVFVTHVDMPADGTDSGRGESAEPNRLRETAAVDVRAIETEDVASDPEGGVQVGRFVRDGNGWKSLPAGRSFAGVRGDHVTAPAARTQLKLGAVPGDDRCAAAIVDQSGARRFLSADCTGRTTISGDLAIAAALQLGPGTVAFSAPPAGEGAPAGDRKLPWSIALAKSPDGKGQQLRVAAGGGTDGTVARVCIGRRGPKGFQPIVTITDGGDVIVEGTLRAALPDAPAPADPTDPRFAQALAKAVREGVAASVPPASGVLKAEIRSVEPGPATRTVSVSADITNVSAGEVTGIVVHQTFVSGLEFMRARKVWPEDGVGSLAPLAAQPVAARTGFAAEEWPSGKPLQVTVRVTARDAQGNNTQAFAVHDIHIPPAGRQKR